MTILTSPAFSSLSLAVFLGGCLIVGLIFAPQPIKRDKRVLVVLALFLLALIGQPVSAVTFRARICDGAYWFWFIECWL